MSPNFNVVRQTKGAVATNITSVASGYPPEVICNYQYANIAAFPLPLILQTQNSSRRKTFFAITLKESSIANKGPFGVMRSVMVLIGSY